MEIDKKRGKEIKWEERICQPKRIEKNKEQTELTKSKEFFLYVRKRKVQLHIRILAHTHLLMEGKQMMPIYHSALMMDKSR